MSSASADIFGSRAWQDLCSIRGLHCREPIACGLDFTVVRVVDASGAHLAVRVPHARLSADVNDPYVDRRALLRQEYEVTTHLERHGVPVARPHALVESDDLDVLISDYLPDDGLGADGEVLGRLLATLHAVPPPPIGLAASEGSLDTNAVLVRRLVRRWSELTKLVPGLPPLPDTDALAAKMAEPAGTTALLHLDVRAANMRCWRRHPVLVDWANALVGDPGLELGRVAEFARIPSNGIDLDALYRGYGSRATELTATPAFSVYRLDAAVMLALVFLSEAPHPTLHLEWTQRATTLADQLRC